MCLIFCLISKLAKDSLCRLIFNLTKVMVFRRTDLWSSKTSTLGSDLTRSMLLDMLKCGWLGKAMGLSRVKL